MLPSSDRNAGKSGGFAFTDLVPTSALRTLVAAVQELSFARTLEQVMLIVRQAARSLVYADGASFILREGDNCFYADESAISPLWKGRRFPMSECVSGWSMMHGKTAVIPDIYADPRIPFSAYRVTFVKSMVMVPIRVNAPLAAIGAYWKDLHHATTQEVELLQALANTTSVAMEDIRIQNEMQAHKQERTPKARLPDELLQDLYGCLLQNHDQESRRFARELHDGVGQTMVAAMLNIRKMQADSANPEISELGEQTLAMLKQSVTEIRSVSHLLHPLILDDLGLAAATRWHILGFSDRNKIPVDVDVAEDLEDLAPNVKSTIFRLIQEALLNIQKHAAATTASVRLTRTRGTLSLTITDNGKGIPQPVPVGVGLQSMMQRVRQLGGHLDLETNPNGTKILVTLPL